MKTLKSLLNKRENLKKISLTDKDIFYIFQKVIKEEFGNYGSEKLKADFFKNKTIFVKCESSNFASELFYFIPVKAGIFRFRIKSGMTKVIL